MKAIIFAAGKGKRMLPLTRKVCKPMLQIHGQPIGDMGRFVFV